MFKYCDKFLDRFDKSYYEIEEAFEEYIQGQKVEEVKDFFGNYIWYIVGFLGLSGVIVLIIWILKQKRMKDDI